jgi:hypothetical protein
VFDYRRSEKAAPHVAGLRQGIIFREQAYTLACVAHHNGEPCTGGGLVGSRDAKKWLALGHDTACFKKMKRFSKNPALAAYFNSLVNLGLFRADASVPDSDEELGDDTATFDDIELSSLGLELATRFDKKVQSLAVMQQLASPNFCCSVHDLADLGRHRGLCELTQKKATERELLRDIFFARVGSREKSHLRRRHSLLLILDLCRQLGDKAWTLDEASFRNATYFGELASKTRRVAFRMTPALADAATRWRMFYFHHFMSVALEGLFCWLTSQLIDRRLAGGTIDSLVERLAQRTVARDLLAVFDIEFPNHFSDLTPSALFAAGEMVLGTTRDTKSRAIETTVTSRSPLAEDTLEDLIRGHEYLSSATGLALPMILLSVTLARYSRWEGTNYGGWLANAATDQYLDLVPPLLTAGLSRRFGDWSKTPFRDLTRFVLSRYVVQQHQSLSYEKTTRGDRCLLEVDGEKIVSSDAFNKIGMGNPRLLSAIQILTDLNLIAEDETSTRHLTPDGRAFLTEEIAKEPVDAVP